MDKAHGIYVAIIIVYYYGFDPNFMISHGPRKTTHNLFVFVFVQCA